MEEKKKIRFVLSITGRLVYYKGYILEQNEQIYVIDEHKHGKISILKQNIIAMRDLEDE